MTTSEERGQGRAEPGAIHSDALYPLPAFYKASGTGRTTRIRAAEHGIELKTFRVGRRKFVRGADAIAFLVAASAVKCEGAA